MRILQSVEPRYGIQMKGEIGYQRVRTHVRIEQMGLREGEGNHYGKHMFCAIHLPR